MRRLLARLDARYVKICAYASVTVLLTLAVAMVLYFSSGFFAKLWMLICAVLEPAVYGALIAHLLNPAVMKISGGLKHAGWQKNNHKLRRTIGMIVCMVALIVVVGCILMVMALVITHSLDGLKPQTIQKLFDDAQEGFGRLATIVQEFLGQGEAATEGGIDLGTRLSSLFRGAKEAFSTILFSIIFSVYILMDGDRVGGYCLRVIRVVAGQKTTDRIMVMLHDAGRVFSGYIRGQFVDALVVGVLTAIVLTLVGVPFGPVVGLLTGLGNLIPYVGAPLGIATTVLVCLVDAQFDKMIIGVVCLALIMFVDSNVINPKLLSDNVEVHPLLVVGALIAGGAVGGLAGMLVAVPAAAFLKVQLDRWLVGQESSDVPCEEVEGSKE
ncbi:MAG: AI-2E family transporter [Coriobacteriales bacterium]|nr:AI-2E family transporter [Coriobacteriales bacterium]